MTKPGRRGLFRLLLKLLPKPIRFSYLRRAIKISDQELPENLEITIAKSKSDLEQAYKILHDAYVENEFQKPDPTGMRIIKHFALPTTTTFVAKWDGRVIGTMSIIREGPFGLPIQSIFDIDGIKSGGKTVAEVSSLAIDREYRHRRGTLFLPLCKYLYLYCRNYLQLDRIVIAVNPDWADFYEGFLNFTLLEKRIVTKYDFANGAPAVGLWLDFQASLKRYFEVYNHRPNNQNWYHYLAERTIDNLKFPDRQYQKIMDPVMTPAMLRYFFHEKSSVFAKLTAQEIFALHNCYGHSSYKFVLPHLPDTNKLSRARYTVHAEGELDHGNEMIIIDVSEKGVKIKGPMPKKTTFNFSVKVSRNQISILKGIVRWVDVENNFYGVELLENDSVWGEYLNYLKTDFKIPQDSKRKSKRAS